MTLTLAGGEPVDGGARRRVGRTRRRELPDLADPAADPLPEDRRGRVEVDLPQFEATVPTFVPDRPVRGGFSLLVVLREPGANGKPIPDALAAAAGRHGVVVAAPPPTNPAGWRPDDLPRLAAAVERMTERYGVGPGPRLDDGRRRRGGGWRGAVAGSAPETYRGVLAPADTVPPRLAENEIDAPPPAAPPRPARRRGRRGEGRGATPTASPPPVTPTPHCPPPTRRRRTPRT